MTLRHFICTLCFALTTAQAAQLTLLDTPQLDRVELRVTADDVWAQWPVSATDPAGVNVLRNLAQVLPNGLPDTLVRCISEHGGVVETRTDHAGRAHCVFPAAGMVRVEVASAPTRTASPPPLAQAAHITVSDLDDTLIVTNVRGGGLKHVLSANALTRTMFPGAVEALREQAKRGPVIYLSNSPDGLDPALRQWLAVHGFPVGPLWLREFPGVSGRRHKAQALDLLARQTTARLTLLGDSGEFDPEIYAAFVRAWPGRVERLLIRDVAPGSRHAEVERLLGGLGVAWAWLPGVGETGGSVR